MDLTPKQKTIHWPTELSQEFGWPNEDINRLLQRLEKISKQHKQQAWEYDAIMQAVVKRHKEKGVNSQNDFITGYQLKSKEYKRISTALIPRIQEIIKSETKFYPIGGAHQKEDFNWNKQIINIIFNSNFKIDANDLIDFFHEAYIELQNKIDAGELEKDKQNPRYFLGVVKNMLKTHEKKQRDFPMLPLSDIHVLIDCFEMSIETPKQAESFFKNIITVGALTKKQRLLFDIIITHAESFDSSNKNRKFWQEVRDILVMKGVHMSEAAFRQMKSSLLGKIYKSRDYMGFMPQSEMDNLRIARDLMELFHYVESTD